MLRLSVKVQEQPVVCVVDSAAEVTIISDKLFQSLERNPPTKRKTTMHAVGRGMRMDAFIAGPFDLKVGSTTYRTSIVSCNVTFATLGTSSADPYINGTGSPFINNTCLAQSKIALDLKMKSRTSNISSSIGAT
jgi:hypothetical protein